MTEAAALQKTIVGIDFGTTATCVAFAVGATGGEVRLASIPVTGDRYPSSVFRLPMGELLTGIHALNAAGTDPASFEATPKRQVSKREASVVLGAVQIPTSELIAAVIAQAVTPATEDGRPVYVVLTHPVAWDHEQQQLVAGAVEQAGLPAPTLLEEPVAAAWAAVPAGVRVDGARYAIYDWGGGTFDVAVVVWEAGAFQVHGSTRGVDPLGGDDIDHALMLHVLASPLLPTDLRGRLTVVGVEDIGARRMLLSLRSGVRNAKHQLSQYNQASVAVGNDWTVPLTRVELELRAGPYVEQTLEEFAACLAESGTKVSDLAGVYLTGDASRLPLVAARFWDRFGIRPVLAPGAKAAVARGAVLWAKRTTTLPAGALPPLDTPTPGPTREHTQGLAPLPAPHGTAANPDEQPLADARTTDDAPAVAPGAPPRGVLPPLGATPGALHVAVRSSSTRASKLGANSVVSGLLGGAVGGLLGAIAIEVSYEPHYPFGLWLRTQSGYTIAIVAAIAGFVLLAWDGFTGGAPHKGVRDGAHGAIAGAVAGFIGGYLARIIFTDVLGDPDSYTSKEATLARVLAWGVFGLLLGGGLGVNGGKQRVISGLIGGAIGGAASGLLFQLIENEIDGGTTLRFAGFACTVAGIGFAIGLVERVRRESWLTITAGPMAGKEFILYNPRTVAGADNRCNIVLAHDSTVVAQHLVIDRSEQGATASSIGGPISVNGVEVTSHRLQAGDQIGVGSSLLTYHERAPSEGEPR